MSTVTFSPSVGGSGLQVSDQPGEVNTLVLGGHRTYFVPALQETVAVAGNVVTKAQAAASSASSAASSASVATTKASQASSSATSASASASTATTKAGEAAASAVAASGSASSASSSASVATTKAAEASSSASVATTKAAEASASAVAAAGSATAAAASVEAYQGSLSSDPSVNKNGQPLKPGDWYINSVSGLIRAYNGTAWVNAINFNGVTSVNTRTGAVTLTKADVGLSNVDNTSDANKPVSSATQSALNLKQNLDATLTALAGLATGANQLPYFTGTDTAAQTPLSAFGRSLIDDSDAGTARTTLGLGDAATRSVQSSPTDTSASSLVVTGGFGWGASAPRYSDWSVRPEFSTAFAFSNSPLPAVNSSFGTGLALRWDTASGAELAFSNATGRGAFRTQQQGVWGDWTEFWTTGNLTVTGYAKTLLDDVDASSARNTLGISVADGGLGYGQSWSVVTGSRASNTNYTNSTGKPIAVLVVCSNSPIVVVGGVTIQTQETETDSTHFIVPPGAVYKVTGTIVIWSELR